MDAAWPGWPLMYPQPTEKHFTMSFQTQDFLMDYPTVYQPGRPVPVLGAAFVEWLETPERTAASSTPGLKTNNG